MRFTFYTIAFAIGILVRLAWEGLGDIAEALDTDKPYQ